MVDYFERPKPAVSTDGHLDSASDADRTCPRSTLRPNARWHRSQSVDVASPLGPTQTGLRRQSTRTRPTLNCLPAPRSHVRSESSLSSRRTSFFSANASHGRNTTGRSPRIGRRSSSSLHFRGTTRTSRIPSSSERDWSIPNRKRRLPACRSGPNRELLSPRAT